MAKQTKKDIIKATAKGVAVKEGVKASPAKAAVKSQDKSAIAKPALKKLADPGVPRPNTVNAYLTFNGNCEEAFKFYRKVLGGEFSAFTRFKDVPPMDGRTVSAAEGKKIMHVALPVSKETMLMGSDASGSMEAQVIAGNNFSISLSVGAKAEADRVFKALSAKGNIVMPLSNTFWGSYFGMVIDKFGIHWMVSFDQPQN